MNSQHKERAGRELASLCTRLFGVREPEASKLLAHAERRAARLQKKLPEYVQVLRADPEEQAALATVATNGWTWFWRESQALLDACARLAQRSERAPLRAWVAGCSTGEEAYTLGIAAAEHGLDLRIVATDVDPVRVAHAREGWYQEAALRHLPCDLAERYFERDGAHWRPIEALRTRVRFEVHNLLSSPLAPDGGEWDLVSCRNVLLHSEGPAARRILTNLSSVLDAFGVRVLSAVDELTVDATRLARSTPVTVRPPPAPPPSGEAPPGDACSGAAANPRALEFEALLMRGNQRLAVHQLAQAEQAYAAAEAIEPGSAELMLMQGLLHRKAGRHRRAEAAIRRALFLEPDLWLGWMLLAGIYERAGSASKADRALRAALGSLERRPRLRWRAPHCGIPDRRMDGSTAKRWCSERLRTRLG